MTPTQAEALGRRWLAAGGGWRPGMLAHDDSTGREHRINGAMVIPDEWWPDLRDAATRGAALDVVRERWGGAVWVQAMICYPLRIGAGIDRNRPVLRWVIGGLHRSDGERINGRGPDGFEHEGEAIAAAILRGEGR